MRARLIPAMVTAGAVVVATAVAGSAAGGATSYLFVGYAGASMVRAANNTITSDLTASSNLNGTATVSDSNDTANLALTSLLKAGAVQTSTAAKAISGGYEVVSRARVADVNILGGAITAAAIQTTTTSSVVHGRTSSTSNSTFVGLKIPGVSVPVTVPTNFAVNIPGIATVILNYKMTAGDASTQMMTIGMGLYIGLLRQEGPNAAGAAVSVNLTYAALGPLAVPPSKHYISASSFGTQVNARAGSVNVRSDPTAPAYLPAGGTNGKTTTQRVAGVNLTSLARVGGVKDTVSGSNTASSFDARSSSTVAGVNLFNGLIRADAITASAHAYGTTTANRKATGSSTLANLVIAGHALPAKAGPNSTFKLLGVGTITLNQQIRNGHSITVRALDIVLGKAQYGFPAGAEIQVAVAAAAVN
jgi:hypothetical protein